MSDYTTYDVYCRGCGTYLESGYHDTPQSHDDYCPECMERRRTQGPCAIGKKKSECIADFISDCGYIPPADMCDGCGHQRGSILLTIYPVPIPEKK